MAFADIDAAATQRRIQAVADQSRKAFDTHAQRSAGIDAATSAAAAKEEADLEAVRERRAEVEARRAAAEQQEKQQDRPTPRPRPATLSLGADEFKLDREARKAAEQAKPAQPPTPSPVARDKPVRKRPPRPEADDDMSGRTWLR
jgi:hypothetical protein